MNVEDWSTETNWANNKIWEKLETTVALLDLFTSFLFGLLMFSKLIWWPIVM